MKKATLISSMLTLASTAAVAGSLNLELRADYQGTSYNDAAKAGTTGLGQDNYKFFIPIGRLDAQGKLGSALDYRLRWRFSKPAVATSTPANNQNDSLNDSVDFAYVSHKPVDMLTVTVGKFASQIGGVEGSYSGSDLYLLSSGNGGATLTNTSLIGKAYYTGAKFETAMGDHKIGLHFANAAADVTNDNGKFAQTSGYTALVYTGSFADGMVKPVVSYHTTTNAAAAGSEKKVGTYLSAGAMFNVMSNLQIDADYLANTYTNGTVATNKDTLNTMVLNVAYKMDNIKPSIKYYSGEEKIKGATDVKTTHSGMSAVVEFKPKMDENFRYHVAYNQYTLKPETGDSMVRTEVVAGVKISADILK